MKQSMFSGTARGSPIQALNFQATAHTPTDAHHVAAFIASTANIEGAGLG